MICGFQRTQQHIDVKMHNAFTEEKEEHVIEHLSKLNIQAS